MPANLLQKDGDRLVIEGTAHRSAAGAGDSVDLAVRVATTTYISETSLGANQLVRYRMEIMRTSATTANLTASWIEFADNSAITSHKCRGNVNPAITWSSSLALDLHMTTTGSTASLTNEQWQVVFYPAEA